MQNDTPFPEPAAVAELRRLAPKHPVLRFFPRRCGCGYPEWPAACGRPAACQQLEFERRARRALRALEPRWRRWLRALIGRRI